ncbi:proteasome subunit beta type-1-B [Trichonephila clavata]|uniref:Proteasome subunit beta type-1-B n=1 Tax=Trichonephila clavata TaxID=2740835 RepID=A0A8X6LZD1_TRICU|nr:proteasome subunit beta type-1-B [Trichonephila clavata]
MYARKFETEMFAEPKQHRFSPYESNEGSIVAIAGGDYAIIASDTRLSTGYSIYSRNQPKLFRLSKKTVLGSAGCWCDVLTLTRILEAKMKMYLHEHNKEMSTPAVSQLLSTLLYYKRFFPYYAANVVAGLDEDGVGRVYSYDSIGSKGTEKYIAAGSSSSLLQPLLDNQAAHKNIAGEKPPPLSLEKAVTLVHDVFTSAAERDIYTGDRVVMNIITKYGIKDMSFDLRKD